MCMAALFAPLAAAVVLSVPAGPLGDFHHEAIIGSSQSFEAASIRVEFRPGDPDGQPFPLWEDLWLTEEDEGGEFVIAAGGDEDFPDVVAILTNGSNDFVRVAARLPVGEGGSEATEAERFFGNPSGKNGIDFKGSRIDSVSMRIDQFRIITVGQRTFLQYGITFTAFGGPECAGDLDGNGEVGFPDLLVLFAAWGECQGCPEDLTHDGVVDGQDIIVLLTLWGSCPE